MAKGATEIRLELRDPAMTFAPDHRRPVSRSLPLGYAGCRRDRLTFPSRRSLTKILASSRRDHDLRFLASLHLHTNITTPCNRIWGFWWIKPIIEGPRPSLWLSATFPMTFDLHAWCQSRSPNSSPFKFFFVYLTQKRLEIIWEDFGSRASPLRKLCPTRRAPTTVIWPFAFLGTISNGRDFLYK